MNFKPELVEKIQAGQKTVTRRVCSDNPRSPWSYMDCRVRPGRAYALCPGRGKTQVGKLAVSDVTRQKLGWIDDADARREGFEDRQGFVDYWKRLYDDFDPEMDVWRVEFSLIHPGDYRLWEGAA